MMVILQKKFHRLVKFRDINIAYQKKVSFFSDMLFLYIYITLNKQKKHIGDISLNQCVPF